MLEGKNIALYVTGGVSIYKTVDLMRTFIKNGAQVRVAMTQAATEFVSPILFEKLSKHKVHVDMFEEETPDRVDHIDLADWSDIAVVSPATANTIAKMSYGLADNMVTSALLASTCPVFVIPAMNQNMYEHPATQENMERLKKRGVYLMNPDTGFLAEGYEGKGRFPEQERIIEEIEMFLRSKTSDLPLKGKKVLVTAGGTQEPIDPVRFITNRSSGKMGHALAEAAFYAGAEVTIISASSLPVHRGIEEYSVKTAEEMYQAVDQAFETSDVLIMAAAVSDYRVKEIADQKMKKQDQLTIELVKNPDILKTMGQKKAHQLVIGFAAETENLIEYANKKLEEKKLDAIFANSVAEMDQGFDAEDNSGYLITKEETVEFPKMSKVKIAEKIMDYVGKELSR